MAKPICNGANVGSQEFTQIMHITLIIQTEKKSTEQNYLRKI